MRKLVVILLFAELAAGWLVPLSFTPVIAQPQSFEVSMDPAHRQADSCLSVNDFDCAIEILRQARRTAVDNTQKAQIHWEIAGIYSFFKKDYVAAAREYRDFVEKYPGHEFADQARFKLGKLFIGLKDPTKAADYLDMVSMNSIHYEEAQDLLRWLQANWKTESYYQARKIMIGISILEVAFVICWILLGKEERVSVLLKRPRFVGLFAIVLVFLVAKLYFNFMLYNLLQGLVN